MELDPDMELIPHNQLRLDKDGTGTGVDPPQSSQIGHRWDWSQRTEWTLN